MRLLVDENLSPLVAELLRSAGHDAAHVRDLGMARDDDVTVLSRAKADDRILVTADTDFGGLLALSGESLPSVILLRRLQGRRAAAQAQQLLKHLDDVQEDLEVRQHRRLRGRASASPALATLNRTQRLLDRALGYDVTTRNALERRATAGYNETLAWDPGFGTNPRAPEFQPMV